MVYNDISVYYVQTAVSEHWCLHRIQQLVRLDMHNYANALTSLPCTVCISITVPKLPLSNSSSEYSLSSEWCMSFVIAFKG